MQCVAVAGRHGEKLRGGPGLLLRAEPSPRHSPRLTRRLQALTPRARRQREQGGEPSAAAELQPRPPCPCPCTARHGVMLLQAAACQAHGEPAEVTTTAALGKSHGKGKHSPLSDLRTNRKSSLRISFWSPRSCKDKDRQVRGCAGPTAARLAHRQSLGQSACWGELQVGSWCFGGGSGAASKPRVPSLGGATGQ